ncbi:MAG: PilN domain-containing protein [Planctomycetota bacterium]|jgi:Tfp pilus assembly protein PilN
MQNIDFVPDDYVQSSESRRTNVMYIVLFTIVMAGLIGSFLTIKVRQKAVIAKGRLVNEKFTQAQEAIKQFEELQARRQKMMETALTTAELLEPIPRSVLLASITNNLPPGVSLLKLKVVQKESKPVSNTIKNNMAKKMESKYDAAKAKKEADKLAEEIQKIFTVINIEIEGIAPTDLQVASFIKSLTISSLLENVALIESKELKIKETTFRQFKLAASMKKNVHLTPEDVSEIRTRAEKTIYNF